MGLVQIDGTRRVVYVNERLGDILGVAPQELVDDTFATVMRDDWPVLDAAITAALRDGADHDLEVQLLHPGGTTFRRSVIKLRALDDDRDSRGALICVEDVTERAQRHEDLERRATLDMLTGCLNRAAVMSGLEAELSRSDGAAFAAVFIDVDDFKTVNDRLGHAAGDEVLITLVNRLSSTVREGDLIGRVGGDEFLVVCPNVGGPDEALRIGQRLVEAMRGQVTIGNAKIEVRSSVGVAVAHPNQTTAAELVTRADVAMYDAKRRRTGLALHNESPASANV